MRCAAFLRAVNVAGHKLSMAQLASMLHDDLHFDDVRTHLQSGNVTFETTKRNVVTLEDAIREAILERLGVRTDVFVRSGTELREILSENPFEREARMEPSRLVVFLLKSAPHPQRVAALRAWIKGREAIAVGSRHLYVSYPDGQGDSKLTNSAIERMLEIRGTARNWNTVAKLHAALDDG